MDRLVKKLSSGKHPVVFESRVDGHLEIKERLEKMKCVFVTFMDTFGETELSLDVDSSLTDLSFADFDNGSGVLHVVGTCGLNYYKVRCIADIDLSTKKGEGYLEVLS